jgi:hypothetical protein
MERSQAIRSWTKAPSTQDGSPKNLRWELPISGMTGVLIADVDRPAADHMIEER